MSYETITIIFRASSRVNRDAHRRVSRAASLVLFQVVAHAFPTLCTVFSRQVYRVLIVMIAGLCLLAKKPTARAIANVLGVVSHDALTRLLTHACWNASLLTPVPDSNSEKYLAR